MVHVCADCALCVCVCVCLGVMLQANKSFFSEIIASISDIRFSRDGRYILARDYMTLKLWDLNMESRPVATFQMHEHLRARVRGRQAASSARTAHLLGLRTASPAGWGMRCSVGRWAGSFDHSMCSTCLLCMQPARPQAILHYLHCLLPAIMQVRHVLTVLCACPVACVAPPSCTCSCATCTRMTVSSTSLTAASMATASMWPAAPTTTPSVCLAWPTPRTSRWRPAATPCAAACSSHSSG